MLADTTVIKGELTMEYTTEQLEYRLKLLEQIQELAEDISWVSLESLEDRVRVLQSICELEEEAA
jgi:hypothetical protein